jgi:hypothetical protein
MVLNTGMILLRVLICIRGLRGRCADGVKRPSAAASIVVTPARLSYGVLAPVAQEAVGGTTIPIAVRPATKLL